MALPLPETLTPSKIGAFVSCPLAFRYSYIDKLPEPSKPYLVKGTLVHRALQILYAEGPAASRTPERARAAVDKAWLEMADEQEVIGLELDAGATGSFLDDSRTLAARCFQIENPAGVHPIGLELDLRAPLEGVELRGIIDRLDHLSDDEFAVVDYKTGRAPRADHARGAMAGVTFYAFLCEAALGRRPREVRLLYLRDQVVLVESPTDQSMRGLRQRALAVWNAIKHACATEDFRPNPSPLCRTCSFNTSCPAYSRVPIGAAATG